MRHCRKAKNSTSWETLAKLHGLISCSEMQSESLKKQIAASFFTTGMLPTKPEITCGMWYCRGRKSWHCDSQRSISIANQSLGFTHHFLSTNVLFIIASRLSVCLQDGNAGIEKRQKVIRCGVCYDSNFESLSQLANHLVSFFATNSPTVYLWRSKVNPPENLLPQQSHCSSLD